MLAKPEYFSPTDEVCCWPGRRTGAAASGHHGRTADLPGHQCRLAGTWQRAIGKQLPVGAVAELQTCRGAVAELLLAVKSYSTIGKRILAKMLARRSSCGMPVELN